MTRGHNRIHAGPRLASLAAAGGLLAALLPALVTGATEAQAATSLTPGRVSLSSAMAGAGATYTIGFTTSGTGSLGLGSSITFSGPAGTSFPTCGVSCSNYSIHASNGSATVSGANVSGSTVQISLLVSSIGASDPVSVTITGVKNPTVASVGDSISESTSADASPVASSNQYSITPGPVAKVIKVSGDGQTAKVGTSFLDPLVVRLEDQFNNDEPAGTPVAFTAPSCGASCASATFPSGQSTEATTTGSDGTANSGAVTAGATAGSFSVTASSGSQSATFTLTDSAGALTSVNLSMTSDVEAATGVTYTVSSDTSATGAVPVGGTITIDAPAGTVMPASGYSVSASGSNVAVSSVALPSANEAVITIGGPVASQSTLVVKISGVTNPKVAGASYSLNESTSGDGAAPTPAYSIVPSAPASAPSVSGNGQKAAEGQPFAAPLAVSVKDKDGNPISGLDVTFSLPASGASGTFQSGGLTDTATTGSDGVATSTIVTAGAAAGTYTASAAVAGTSLVTSFQLQNVVSLKPGALSISSLQAGAAATYVVPFTTSTNGACGSGCSITFGAPSGTVFPTTAGDYAISVSNGHSAIVGSVSAPAGYDGVVINLSASTIGAQDAVTVTIAGVGNPTTAGSGNVIDESTSADSTPVPSNDYTIGPAAPAVVQVVLGDAQSAFVGDAFPSPLISYVSDAYGNPVPGAIVTFTAPSSMGGAMFATCNAGNPPSQCLARTDGSGYALAPELVAGTASGVFDVTATAGTGRADFSLTVVQSGYWLAASDGGLFPHGGAPYYGSEGGTRLNKPVVGMAAAANGGYYMVASDGGVFTFGGAPFYGSTGNMRLNAPVVGMAVDPQTGGYWLVAADGGIFNFNAPFWGSEGGTHLNQPIVGMAATPQGGYYLVASDGGIFNFGPGAAFYGSEGGTHLNQPVVGMAEAPGGGYYMVARDGGIFNFGPGAIFQGSAVGETFAPIVGMAVDPATGGYWLVASNGSIFNFGSAPFYGDESAQPLNQPIVGMATSAGA